MLNNYQACTSILIGKNATVDGSTMIGRNEDSRSAWPKYFVKHNHIDHESNPIFKSHDNHFQLTLPKHQFAYSATPEWTKQYGLFEEDGINEFNVAMSATESNYANDDVLSADPLVKDGIGEEAMVTVVLPYIKTARDGVKRLGSLIEKYGSDENNGILFSDENEVWYMENGSGHHWVAVKIPDDSYAVVANQIAIQEINFSDQNHYMWSKNIKKFVQKYHLNHDVNHQFNFRNIFGTHNLSDTYYNTPRVWYGQKMFNPEVKQQPNSQEMPMIRKADRLLSINDAKTFLSSHYQGTEYDPVGNGKPSQKHKFRPISLAKTQESHVLQIRPNKINELKGIQWLAMGVAAESIYVPFFTSMNNTPNIYQTKADAKQYNPDSAYWVYKLTGVLLDSNYSLMLPKVENVQQILRIKLQNRIFKFDQKIQQINHLNQEQIIKKINEFNQKNAEIAFTAFKKLNYQLIADSTNLSPLNYHQDLNL
ncbi:dipeptidase [Philodulcilactobacillus myokoensis]|uniref:Dipeptidase n=1 Tax=Philodulcilactobacillus myokoensis TaxID=2929573 RepID=A0A9W6B0P6_9LACO|nr:C69 family dipeptidase [Philodulcilactobacillus myokoensis]GLB46834.1 dipeptidase [Philodulcilactobacillus myokoensis]